VITDTALTRAILSYVSMYTAKAFNAFLNLAKQVVLVNSPYTIQHFIMDELNKKMDTSKTQKKQSLAVQI
jgi:hypothetical protein